jgi:RNA polymerase sigma factor (sigma-70 family)
VPETDAGGEDFTEFVAGSLPALLRFGYVLTGSPQEAEDLVQDALAKSLRRWRRARADNPVAYTRRVMINTHLTWWRRWGARVRLGDVPEAATDDAGLRRGEDWDALRRALARLPSRQRAVLVLPGWLPVMLRVPPERPRQPAGMLLFLVTPVRVGELGPREG